MKYISNQYKILNELKILIVKKISFEKNVNVKMLMIFKKFIDHENFNTD